MSNYAYYLGSLATPLVTEPTVFRRGIFMYFIEPTETKALYNFSWSFDNYKRVYTNCPIDIMKNTLNTAYRQMIDLVMTAHTVTTELRKEYQNDD